MKRVSEIASALVVKAIEGLEVLAVEREKIEWEVSLFVGIDGNARWIVGIGLPVPLTGDTEMPFGMISDPHDGNEIARVVAALYAKALQDVSEAAKRVAAASNGHQKSSGGLIVP
jgi:hypothetical protein